MRQRAQAEAGTSGRVKSEQDWQTEPGQVSGEGSGAGKPRGQESENQEWWLRGQEAKRSVAKMTGLYIGIRKAGGRKTPLSPYAGEFRVPGRVYQAGCLLHDRYGLRETSHQSLH